jgi:hypothetical protein
MIQTTLACMAMDRTSIVKAAECINNPGAVGAEEDETTGSSSSQAICPPEVCRACHHSILITRWRRL